MQIAVVADSVGGDSYWENVMGRIACASKGRIAYSRFDEDLSILGYAACANGFGASLYEPFGQNDVVANIFGATATNRDTGGYHDKISPLMIKSWGEPEDGGNGFLFKNYDAPALEWALNETAKAHRKLRKDPELEEEQVKRIMNRTRDRWSLNNMIAGYIAAYERLNNNKPLV